MGKLLLVAAAAVLVAALAGGGGGQGSSGAGVFAAAAERRSAPVVFPDFLPAFTEPTVVVSDPPPCLGKSDLGGDVCVEDPEYDDNIRNRVLTLLSQDLGVNSLLTDPELRTILNDPDSASTIEKIDTRIGVTSESPVCAAQETLIYPKRAKTSRNDWVFVLNQEGVEQALRVEKCIGSGASCGFALPGDATATCRQKYVYRRMLVLGSNKIEPEEVLMPSCCVCYTTHQDLGTRARNFSEIAPPGTPPVSAVPAPPTPPPQPNPTFMGLNFARSIENRRRLFSFPGHR